MKMKIQTNKFMKKSNKTNTRALQMFLVKSLRLINKIHTSILQPLKMTKVLRMIIRQKQQKKLNQMS